MVELGKIILLESTKGADGTVPPSVFAEMVFRKIELLSAPPPPKPPDEEEVDPKAKSKAKAKAKGKAAVEEPEEIVRANGVLLLGYLAEFGQHVSWDVALRGYMSPLLRINDGEADLQAQLSSVIAPWRFEEVDIRTYVNVPHAVGAQSPVKLLRLRHCDHAELCKMVISEASNTNAWQIGDFVPADAAPTPAPTKEAAKGGKKPAKATEEEEVPNEVPPRVCQGYEVESLNMTNPVDRAWLYEDAQAFVQHFTAPLDNCQDLSAECRKEGDEVVETVEAALCRKVLDIASGLQATKAPEAEEGEAATADDPPAAEIPAEGVFATEPLATTASVSSDGPPWISLPDEARAEMRRRWLENLSEYITKLNSTMGAIHQEASDYGQGLKDMQRGFLESLQATDEKTAVMTEYLQAWPQRSFGRREEEVDEEVEELSDQLWQHTDRRRAESIDEHDRLVENGFWENHATATLNLAIQLYSHECDRFNRASELLLSSHGLSWSAADISEDLSDTSPQGLSSLADLVDWFQDVTQGIASRPLPLPFQDGAELRGDLAEEDPLRSNPIEDGFEARAELQRAIAFEKLRLMQRLRSIESWTIARLTVMREQIEETFRRMDDWIRDRVRAENIAINAAVAKLKDGQTAQLEEDEMKLSRSGSSFFGRSTSKRSWKHQRSDTIPPSPTGGPVQKLRKQVLKALEAKTLDVDVLRPPKLEVALAPPEGAQSLAEGRPASRQSRMSKQSTQAKVSEGRWSQDMLTKLVSNLVSRSGGSAAAVSAATLTAAILEQRSSGFQFDVNLVPPLWVKRSEATLATFCSALVNPEWGNVAVDVTELILALTFHERQISWPTMDALMASRQLLESKASGLTEKQLDAFPDVPVNEELFMKLPLWNQGEIKLNIEPPSEQVDGVKRWLFRVLACFEKEDQPLLSSVTAESTAISARRMFMYLALGAAPMAGLSQMLKLLLTHQPKAGTAGDTGEGDSAPDILIHHLWQILFSVKGRPAACEVPPPPDLADFCVEVAPPPEPEPVETKGKAGKNAPPPPDPSEAEPPPPPEEMKVAFDEEKLMRNKAVLRGLCTHGGLFCRQRALSLLFPAADVPGPSGLHTAAESLVAEALTSIVPPPSTPAADEAEAGENER
jgi:hypothetical protein